ncbi:MAG: protein kinase [Oscillospiraceae bacterium]|jgi:serine/threonine protein kinase|nr:protein kinase [Oscillospiraceae bacterium]
MSTENLNLLCTGCFSQLPTAGAVCGVCGYSSNTPLEHLYQLPPRTILSGKYMVGRVLGEGGFGITYVGYDLNLEMKVAIKEYYPSGFVMRDSDVSTTVQTYAGEQGDIFRKGRERFVDEAKRLARFRVFAGIVMVNDFFVENGTAYIVMEYVEGVTLKSYIAQRGGKLPPEELLEMLRPMFGSLAQIHESGIIHRDISPDNIMVTVSGDVKLLDFGAAREFGEEGNKSLSVLLKHGYAPMEQYATRGVQGPHTDVYALSATIYKAITGITPESSMDRVIEDRVEPPSKLGIILHEYQESALMKGLAIRQADRFQTISELFLALMPPVVTSAQSLPLDSASPFAVSVSSPSSLAPLHDPYHEQPYKQLHEPHEPHREPPYEPSEPQAPQSSEQQAHQSLQPAQTSETDDIQSTQTPAPKRVAMSKRSKIIAAIVAVSLVIAIAFVLTTFLQDTSETPDGNIGGLLPDETSDSSDTNDDVGVNSENDTSDESGTNPEETLAPSPEPEPVRIYLDGLYDEKITDSRLAEMIASGEIPANVTDLTIHNHPLSDISPISELKELRNLDLSGTNISDLSPFGELSHLTYLVIGDAFVNDITPISRLSNLTFLRLSGCRVSDISPISGLLNLSTLFLDSNPISDVTTLKELINLQWLYLNHTLLTDWLVDDLRNALPNCEIDFEQLVTYEGDFDADGMRSGYGVLTLIDRSGNEQGDIWRYEGQWANDKPNGLGKLYSIQYPRGTNTILEGNFIDGLLHGTTTWTWLLSDGREPSVFVFDVDMSIPTTEELTSTDGGYVTLSPQQRFGVPPFS